VGVEPAEPHPGGAGGPVLFRSEQVPGDLGGQGAVPDEPGGFLRGVRDPGTGAGGGVAVEGGVGHDEVDLDRDGGGGFLPGEQFDEQVGADLVPGAARGPASGDDLAGGLSEGLPRGDALGFGQQG